MIGTGDLPEVSLLNPRPTRIQLVYDGGSPCLGASGKNGDFIPL